MILRNVCFDIMPKINAPWRKKMKITLLHHLAKIEQIIDFLGIFQPYLWRKIEYVCRCLRYSFLKKILPNTSFHIWYKITITCNIVSSYSFLMTFTLTNDVTKYARHISIRFPKYYHVLIMTQWLLPYQAFFNSV